MLDAYAGAVTYFGPSGSGQLAKMVNQICIAGCVQGLSEAIAFGMNAGLDMPKVIEALSSGAASSWQMVNRGRTMVKGEFDFGFAVDWMRKDLGIVKDEAARNGSDIPVTRMVDSFYEEVQKAGGRPLGYVKPHYAPSQAVGDGGVTNPRSSASRGLRLQYTDYLH